MVHALLIIKPPCLHQGNHHPVCHNIIFTVIITGSKRSCLPRINISCSGEPSTSTTPTSSKPSSVAMSPIPSEVRNPPLADIPSSQPGASYEVMENETASQDQLKELLVMFPSVPSDGVKFLFKISNHNAIAVTECLVNLTIEGILEILRPAVIHDTRRLRLDSENW